MHSASGAGKHRRKVNNAMKRSNTVSHLNGGRKTDSRALLTGGGKVENAPRQRLDVLKPHETESVCRSDELVRIEGSESSVGVGVRVSVLLQGDNAVRETAAVRCPRRKHGSGRSISSAARTSTAATRGDGDGDDDDYTVKAR